MRVLRLALALPVREKQLVFRRIRVFVFLRRPRSFRTGDAGKNEGAHERGDEPKRKPSVKIPEGKAGGEVEHQKDPCGDGPFKVQEQIQQIFIIGLQY